MNRLYKRTCMLWTQKPKLMYFHLLYRQYGCISVWKEICFTNQGIPKKNTIVITINYQSIIFCLLLTLREPLCSPVDYGGVCVAHRFSSLCCVFSFICPRPVSCVPNVASFSGLSIIDCHFGFLWRLFNPCESCFVS